MRTKLKNINFDMGHFHYISPWKWKYHPFRFKKKSFNFQDCGNGKANREKNPHCNKQKSTNLKGMIICCRQGGMFFY